MPAYKYNPKERNKHAQVCQFIKRLVLAWDPDYTRLTAGEKRRVEEAEDGEYVNADEIDWDSVE